MPDNIVTFRNARFTVLTSRLIRMEWSAEGAFEDRLTMAVASRDFPSVDFRKQQSEDHLLISTDHLTIGYKYNGKPFSAENLKITYFLNGQELTWRYGISEDRNLGGTIRTLDMCTGDKKIEHYENPDYVKGAAGDRGKQMLERKVDIAPGKGLVSKSGWSLLDDSRGVLLDGDTGSEWAKARPDGEYLDWYFFGYGHDYAAAIADGSRLLGRQPLPPRYTFGNWWSRYWAYRDDELEDLVSEFDRMDVPLDVLVIDMDWHLEGWTGYTWDRRYFPDPDDFLKRMKDKGVQITLNLHPADGVAKHEAQFEDMCRAMDLDPAKADKVPFDCTDPKFIKAYFELLHHPEEKRGVDFWWMDWQQGTETAIPGLDPLPWLNHLHWRDMEKNAARDNKRPLIFSRYGGPGAGRYNVGFSGDTFSNWNSLKYQVHFTAVAANALYGYWSHDLGGHINEDNSPELFTRWLQFGIFSPIVRTHCSKDGAVERRIWKYPDPWSSFMSEVLHRRYEIVPYIYSECRRTWETGLSLCRPLYYQWPEAEDAYRARDQYMFGADMLVCPVVSPADEADTMAAIEVWLPEGHWIDTARGQSLEGGRWIKGKYLVDEIPVFVRPGTVIPGERGTRRLSAPSINDLVITAYPGADGEYILYEDDGLSSDYLKDRCTRVRIRQTWQDDLQSIVIDPVSGEYPGYQPQKSLELRLPLSLPPVRVSAVDREISWSYRNETNDSWHYDGNKAEIAVRLAEIDTRKGLKVEITHTSSDDRRNADGLRGRLNRFRAANYYHTLALFLHILHKDERCGIQAAQAGNRMSRRPDTWKQELEGLKTGLPLIRKVLGELWHKGHSWEPKENYGEGSPRQRNCNIALAILKDLE